VNARYWNRKEHTALDKKASSDTDQVRISGYEQTLRVNPPRRAAVNSGKNEKPPDGDDGRPGADEQSGRTRLSRLELYPIRG
jgi:hypothetical protein